MPTRRGWAALATGLGLWVAARFMGSSDLHMVAVGLAVLPVLSTVLVRWGRVRIDVTRHLSAVRVFPGTRVTVTLTVENTGRTTIPFMLVQDALPATLGRPARLVVAGVPPRNEATVSYSFVCRERGRFRIGPLTTFVTDPFGLSRLRVPTSERNELIVYPRIDDLEAGRLAARGAGSGESAARQLYRSAAEFYTMREYVTGDDLRRIHWPSVAHTGSLMIRQDESTRRSWATLFLDNRTSTLGASGSPAFERAVSSAASVGRLLIRAGFSLTLVRADAPATPVTETALLEILAGVGAARGGAIADLLMKLRATAPAESTLAVVAGVPSPGELASISRTGTTFGRRIAILVHPLDASTLQPIARSEFDARATAATATLRRSGWDVYVLNPHETLGDEWRRRDPRRAHALVPA